jgi:hypothetical protein
MMLTVVYWIFDKDQADPDPCLHGYIGVTNNLSSRLSFHRSKRGVVEHCVLLQGSTHECLALEAKLRPTPLIGWNKLPGGSPLVRGQKQVFRLTRQSQSTPKLRRSVGVFGPHKSIRSGSPVVRPLDTM